MHSNDNGAEGLRYLGRKVKKNQKRIENVKKVD
jgi:hypothetical protein